MAEVDPFDPFKPHEGGDEHKDEEHSTGLGGHYNTGFDPDYDTEEQRQRANDIIKGLRNAGISASSDLYYSKTHDDLILVSEDKLNWYWVKKGFINGEMVIGLIPYNGSIEPPDSLKLKFGLETSHEEEMTEGPVEYINKVFENPDLTDISYGIDADDRVWVMLKRAGSKKYYIREDGTAEDAAGKTVDFPKTLRSYLGKTIIESMTEREEKIRANRQKEEYISRLQEMDQVNIELRERNKEIEEKRVDLNKELKEKDDLITSLQSKLDENQSHFEQLGEDMLALKDKEEHDRRLIKDLQESLEGTVSASEKARLTAEMQMLVRENANNIEAINEKEGQLRQSGRVIDQQKYRIGELERQKEELEATITYQQREIERNNAQVERNESEIGDQDLQDAERERQELENENEQLEERNQEGFARLSLREKVKCIFRKYGVTVIGVLAAVGTIIGVIVSNLKAGLQKVATGVGNGLTAIGKKLGQILPGMVGAIVSFLFKIAGEAVGFLAKDSWLLIVLVVTFALDQFKSKRKRS